MLEVSFSCPLCSRLLVRDCPYEDGRVPEHLDHLLGTPCQGSRLQVEAFLEIPEHPHGPDWPRFERRPAASVRGSR